MQISLVGAPIQTGTDRGGCVMGPDAYRTAQLPQTLRDLGHDVRDLGNLSIGSVRDMSCDNPNVHDLAQTVAWTKAVHQCAYEMAHECDVPIFLGGDHSMAAGTVTAMAAYAAQKHQPQFVLWLDAHPDLHRLETTASGNLHGTPAAYFMGFGGFEPHFPPVQHPIDPSQFCLVGARSVDAAERALITEHEIDVVDMRRIDEEGIKAPLIQFLDRVRAAQGRLHVSLDVDFLDPEIACAVGTTVPGGATFREAHLVMEVLHESGLVTSLDLVELNPFLDERGKTAKLMVDLCASLFGRTVLDKRTRSY